MSTIAELRESLKDLEATMEAERQQHAMQKDEQGARIKQLEGRLAEQDQAKFKKIQESRTATKTTSASGTKTTTTTTTTKTTPQKQVGTNDGSQTPTSASGGKVKFSNKDKKSPSVGGGGKQEKLTNGSTALQHSWDKFCVCAKNDFSPKELSLMSLETIKSLLNHYNYNNPIEIAQIEAQWALIQDGEKAVMSPTPHCSPSNRARSFSPMPVKDDFCLRTNVLKPHLSVRGSMSRDSTGSADPQGSCERHRSASYTGAALGAKQNFDPRASNPNDGPLYPYRVSSVRSLTNPDGSFPFTHKVYPRGKDRSKSPNAKEMTTYPEEVPAGLNAGKKLFNKPSPGRAKVMGLKMVSPHERGEEKKRSIRFIPQKGQVVIG